MEGNRDEAERCIELAITAIKEGKFGRAEKFLVKAEKLYPSQRAKDLLDKVRSTPTANGTAESPSGRSDGVHHRRPPTSPKRDGKPSEPEFTSDQLEAVKRIKKCKDYYEVLGVTKEATDSEIKKAYKKLALQLHPDKNKSPGAAEAFKAIGNAVAILTDPEKRKSYDLHGTDEPSQYHSMGRRHYSTEYAYTRGFEADFSAEELFNMFFGNNFSQPHPYMRQRRYHRPDHQHQREPQQQGYTALINLLPILILIGVSMTSSFFISDPIYSLQPSHRYHVERKTNSLKVPYYVKDNFHLEFQGSVVRLEASVEEEYINFLRHSCSRERNYKEATLTKAKAFGDRDLFKKATSMSTPACENLQKLLNS